METNNYDITDIEMGLWNIRNESKKLTQSLSTTIDLIENPDTIVEVKDDTSNITIEGKIIHMRCQIKTLKYQSERIRHLLEELETGIQSLEEDNYSIESFTEKFEEEYENIIDYYTK